MERTKSDNNNNQQAIKEAKVFNQFFNKLLDMLSLDKLLYMYHTHEANEMP